MQDYLQSFGQSFLIQHVTWLTNAFQVPESSKHLKKYGPVNQEVTNTLESLGHVNDGKLQPIAKKCLFLKYSTRVKGYKLWCLDLRKAIINKDVTFKEDELLGLEDKTSGEVVDYDVKQLMEFQVEES